jgi:hypothetical protein
MWFVDPAPAGIITFDSNNIVTSWSSDTAGETFYFYKGSYNDNSSIIFEGYIPSDEFQNDLVATSALPELPMYAFYVENKGPFNKDWKFFRGICEINGTWSAEGRFVHSGTATQHISYALPENIYRDLYWASTTAPSYGTVPEPSTAIAMGLLGVVGFAGNRRRRRTALNA